MLLSNGLPRAHQYPVMCICYHVLWSVANASFTNVMFLDQRGDT